MTEHLTWLASELLRNANMETTDTDIAILAADLATVRFEVAVDGPYKGAYSTAQLFLSRIGGIGALPRYMPCIRSKQ
jgi:hypothetical protein